MARHIPKRTIKRSVDLRDLRSISSDELLALDADSYQILRREATRAFKSGQPIFVCAECEHEVHAPREPRTKLPYWKHRKGSPVGCKWWSGDGLSVDEVDARKFDGAQESPLHKAVKTAIGEILTGDPRTAEGSVIVDRYIVDNEGRRRPDVRARYDGHDTVFEVQLSATQIPHIVGREDFYEKRDHRLIWVTWDFEPVPRAELRTAFEDIFYSHNKNLFSVDSETMTLSRAERTVIIRAFWEGTDGWKSSLVPLSGLKWMENGRAYVVAPPPAWRTNFLARWREATTDAGTHWEAARDLFAEAAEHLGLPDRTGGTLNDADVSSLINCLLSLQDGRPLGSRQTALPELLNTFFSTDRRWRFAGVVKRFAEGTGQAQLLARSSTYSKLTAALEYRQDGRKSDAGRLAVYLFPEVLDARG